MAIGKTVARRLAPLASRSAPRAAAGLIRAVLDAAIEGRARVPGAAEVADRQRSVADGDAERAVHEVIEQHVRFAGAQGFVTSLGGIVVLPLSLPTNIAGMAVLQARMVAAIAHLRGYDLDDPRVRTAVAACLLGEDAVRELVHAGSLPSTPLAIATAPATDPGLPNRVAAEVGTVLTAQVGGKRLGTVVTRRVPILGGGVGAVVDAVATYRTGRYADREFPNRRRD